MDAGNKNLAPSGINLLVTLSHIQRVIPYFAVNFGQLSENESGLPKMKVGLSDHQSVCLSVSPLITFERNGGFSSNLV
jgi:hypothetical protein